MEFDAELVRVYFNRAGDPEKAWSIDTGPGTPEIIVGSVCMEQICAVTKYDPSVPLGDQQHAKAWIEFIHAHVVVTVSGGIAGAWITWQKTAP